MHVEVIQEIESDDAKLELPGSAHSTIFLRYVDLKEFAAQIEQLEERRRYPALCLLLVAGPLCYIGST